MLLKTTLETNLKCFKQFLINKAVLELAVIWSSESESQLEFNKSTSQYHDHASLKLFVQHTGTYNDSNA